MPVYDEFTPLRTEMDTRYNRKEGSGALQTQAGAGQEGGDYLLTSNPTAVKGLIILGDSVYDEGSQRLGIRTWEPGYALDVAGGGVRFQEFAGTAGLLEVDSNGVVTIGGSGSGGGWSRNTTAATAVLLPANISDHLTVGEYDAANSPNAALLLNKPSTFAGAMVHLQHGGIIPFGVWSDRIGINVTAQPTQTGININSMPIRFTGTNTLFTAPGDSSTAIETTKAGVIGLQVGGTTYYLPYYAASGGGGGGGGNPADTFTRGSDSTTSLGTSSSGHAWTAQTGTWGVIDTATNGKGYCSTANATFNVATLAGQDENGAIQVTLSTAVALAGLAFRWAGFGGTATGYIVQAQGNPLSSWGVSYWNGSSFESVATISEAPASGDIIKVELATTSPKLKVSINGTLKYSSTAAQDDATSGVLRFNTTSALHGLMTQSGVTSARFDDYSGPAAV